MKNIEIKLKKRKRSKLSLRARMTLLVGGVVLGSTMLALGIASLLRLWFPVLNSIPMLIQMNIIGLGVAMVATNLLSKIFFDPIKDLRKAMQKVADGDFSVHLETKSTSVEIQELFDGFNIMVRELESTEILQTDFVSNVSHEFKTPINAIEGYATLLQSKENIDDVEDAYIEKILFNTRRLSSLVSNILLLSKIESQSIQTNRQWYGLDEQIRESIVSLEAAWEPKDIDFDVDMEDISYYGSEKLMYHVWTNLISNAIKFSSQGGQIRIRLRHEEKNIFFSIEDDGPGISENALKHIFDKFYQEDTSHKAEGNGLGLALTKRILTMSDGTIAARNLPEGGCRFEVSLVMTPESK